MTRVLGEYGEILPTQVLGSIPIEGVMQPVKIALLLAHGPRDPSSFHFRSGRDDLECDIARSY